MKVIQGRNYNPTVELSVLQTLECQKLISKPLTKTACKITEDRPYKI